MIKSSFDLPGMVEDVLLVSGKLAVQHCDCVAELVQVQLCVHLLHFEEDGLDDV